MREKIIAISGAGLEVLFKNITAFVTGVCYTTKIKVGTHFYALFHKA